MRLVTYKLNQGVWQVSSAVIDVTEAYEHLLGQRHEIAERVNSEVSAACATNPRLRANVLSMVEQDTSQDSIYRLLPLALFTDRTSDAQLVAALSRVWWCGAENFDDFTDGKGLALRGLTAREAVIACTACVSVLPATIVSRQHLPTELELALHRELAATSLHAAEGQLDDLMMGDGDPSWGRITRSYIGKTGAAYGRDIVMTALLAGSDHNVIPTFRAFGQLFGLLRQMANDSVAVGEISHEDWDNATHTLLLASAVNDLSHEGRGTLRRLRTEGRQSHEARRDLIEMLRTTGCFEGYNGRVEAIRGQLTQLIGEAFGASGQRDLVQWMINSSAQTATVK